MAVEKAFWENFDPRYAVQIVNNPGISPFYYVIDTHEANARLDGCHLSYDSALRIARLMNGLEANAAIARANIAKHSENR